MPEISLPLMQRQGELSPQSFNADDNAIDLIFTTGAAVRRVRYTWDGAEEFDEELIVSANAVRLDRLNRGAPFLDTHNAYSLAGVIGAVIPGSARIAGGQGIARVQLSRAEPDAAVVGKVASGIIRNISVGYRIHQVERIEKDGQLPLVRVVDWEPMELSAVPIGADPGAAIRAADRLLWPAQLLGDEKRAATPATAQAGLRMRMRQAASGRLPYL